MKLERNDKIALLLIFTYIAVFFKPVIAGDGWGYYAILEGFVRDSSLDLVNQTRFNNINPGLSFVYYYNTTGTYAVGKPFGLSILSAPFYAASLLLDDFQMFHIKDDFFLKEREDILVHMAAMPIASLGLLAAGLLATIALVRLFYKKYGGYSVALAFFSSPLLIYASYDLSYTHAAEAGIMAILAYAMVKERAATSGALIGLLGLIRYTSFLFMLPLLAFFVMQKKTREALVCAASAMPFAAAIAIYWLFSFGGLFAGHATYYDYSLAAIPQNVFGTFLGLESGMLLWTPGIVVAMLGLFYWKDSKKWVFMACILSYLLFYNAYLNSPYGGSGFGIRWYAVFFPMFALGFAALQERWKKTTAVLFILALYTFSVSLLYLGHPVENFNDLIGFWLADGNIAKLPELVFEKVGIVRFIIEK